MQWSTKSKQIKLKKGAKKRTAKWKEAKKDEIETHIVQNIRPLIILGRPPKIVSDTNDDAEKCETNTGRCGNLPHSVQI